jgi:hypothetical protein
MDHTLALPLLIALVALALAFDFLNGLHDAANAIATVVATRLLSPVMAVLFAAAGNFAAYWIMGLHVAETVGKGIIDKDAVTPAVVFGALVGAMFWNVVTWIKGIPSSSSHALIGGLLGAGVAWAFCYVLPSWERGQIPALVQRTLAAQALHARLALGLGQLRAVDTAPELEWRLARREAFDSLSALVQATQRSLSEPRAVRPPIGPLEHLQAHSYQLLAQLSAVKSMLVLRRDRLTPGDIEGPLSRAAARIEATIGSPPSTVAAPPDSAPTSALGGAIPLPDPFDNDISPWLLRRLDLALGIATQLRDDAARILQPDVAKEI